MSTSISQLQKPLTRNGTEEVFVSRHSDTAVVTDITISAQASDNSFNDTNGNLDSIGLEVGDRIAVIGFTNATNNIESGVITSITANKIIIGGVDGDVIVDEAAGNSVSIIKWESVKDTYIPDTSLQTVDTLAELQAVSTTGLVDGQSKRDMDGRTSAGDGGGGRFVWRAGDQSANVAADEVGSGLGNGGIWIAPSSDLTGASGSWERINFGESLPIEAYGAYSTDADISESLEAALKSVCPEIILGEDYTLTTRKSITLTANKIVSGIGSVVWGGGALDNNMVTVVCDGNSCDWLVTIDGSDLASGGIRIQNTTSQTGVLPTCRVAEGKFQNFYMTNQNIYNTGITIVGSFEEVILENYELSNIGRANGTGVFGSSGTAGTVVFHSASTYWPKKVIHRNNTYSGIYSEEAAGANDVDVDYLIVALPAPTNFPNDNSSNNEYPRAHVESHSNTYNNPIGRCEKFQCVPWSHHNTVNRHGGRTINGQSNDINCQWGVGTVEDITYNLAADGGQSPITTEYYPVSFFHGSTYGALKGSATARRIVVHNNIQSGLNQTITGLVNLRTSTGTDDQDVGQVVIDDYTVVGGDVDAIVSCRFASAVAPLRLNNIVVPQLNNSAIALDDTGTGMRVISTNVRHYGTDVPFIASTGGGARNYFGTLEGMFNYGFDQSSFRNSPGGSTQFPIMTGALAGDITEAGGLLTVLSAVIGDDETYTFPERGYTPGMGIIALSTTFAGVGDLFALTGSSSAITALTTSSAGSFALGVGSNPDTDTKINMWVDASGQINIKNRLGSTRAFTMTFIG